MIAIIYSVWIELLHFYQFILTWLATRLEGAVVFDEGLGCFLNHK